MGSPRGIVKHYVWENRSKDFVYIPRHVGGPEYGDRLAITEMFDPDALDPDTFEREEDPLTGEVKVNAADEMKLHSGFDSFSSFMKRNMQKQKDPDSPHQSDAVKRNQVVLLNREETDKALRDMRQGNRPPQIHEMAELLKGFKRANDVRQNRIETKKAQKQHQDNIHTTAWTGVILAIIGVFIVWCGRDYLNEKWSDLDTAERIILSLTIICPLSVIFLFVFGT